MAVIVAPFGLFQVQMEGVFRQTLELGEANFGHSPEALDPVDMNTAPDELVLAVIDPEVPVPEVDQSVVGSSPRTAGKIGGVFPG